MFLKRILIFLVLLISLAPALLAQSTTVSGTVTDAGGQTWNGGTFSFQFVPSPFSQGPYTWTGGTLNKTITGSLNGSGAYSVSVPSTSAISPGGTAWAVTFCSAATWPCFNMGNITIQGTTQSLSATPPAIAIALINPTPSPMKAYSDAEIVSAVVSAYYYNLTSQVFRVCQTVTGQTCTAWAVSGGGGGGGGLSGLTPGQVPIAATPTTAASSVPANTTVNGQTCALGSTCSLPFSTLGATNSSQAGLNQIASTVNATGLSATPDNTGGGNTSKIEIGGLILPVSINSAGAGNPNNTICPSGPGYADCATGIVLGNNGTDVVANYTVGCDGTAKPDRGKELETNGTFTLTVPAVSTVGCQLGFPFFISNISGTLTVSSSSNFVISNANGAPTTTTSFPLAAGQYASLRNVDNVSWRVYLSPVGGSSDGWYTAASPTFSPTLPFTGSAGIVTITCPSSGTDPWYTLNGGLPPTQSATTTTISTSSTVLAQCKGGGFDNSVATGGLYSITGAPAFVQDAILGTTCFKVSLSCSLTFSGGVTATNAIAVFAESLGGGTFSSPVFTDNCGSSGGASDTYTVDTNVNVRVSAHTLIGASKSCTITYSFAQSGGFAVGLYAQEITGVNQTTPVGSGQFAGQQQASPGTSADAITTGAASITTTQTNTYLSGYCGQGNQSANTIVAGTGFTGHTGGTFNGNGNGFGESKAVAATGGTQVTCTDATHGADASTFYNSMGIAFQHP